MVVLLSQLFAVALKRVIVAVQWDEFDSEGRGSKVRVEGVFLLAHCDEELCLLGASLYIIDETGQGPGEVGVGHGVLTKCVERATA